MRIKNYDMLTNHGNLEGRKILADIMEAGLSAADPYANTLALVRREGAKLIFEGLEFEPKGDPRSGPAIYNLDEIDRVFVFGVGKGIQRITKALEDVLGDYLTDGHVVAKHGDDVIMERMGVTLAGHPVPDIHCVVGNQKILDIITEAKLTENDLVITAIGNGVSALMTLPWVGIPIEDVTEATRLMQIEYGVNTGELNQIRVSVDQLKGGRISRLIHPAKMVHIVGVAPTPMGFIATSNISEFEALVKRNGWLHTLCVTTTYTAALKVIEKYDTAGKMPKTIVDFLTNYDSSQDAVRWDEFDTFDYRVFGVMPKSRTSLAIGMQRAEALGYTPHFVATVVTDAAPAGAYMSRIARAIEQGLSSFKAPCALFTDGELIVACGENPGIGGTNQEYCLAASRAIAGSKRIVVAGSDTDGTDGPGGEFHPDATALGITCLTGGIVDGYTSAELDAKGVDVHKALLNHATSEPLWIVGSGIAAVQNISVGDYACTIVMDHDG